MKRLHLFRKVLAVVFAVAVVFTVSVHNVHYLFEFHDAHEHCENHLHAADKHSHCAVCKFDVSVMDDEINQLSLSGPAIFSPPVSCFYASPVIAKRIITNALRGPPERPITT